MLFGKKKKETQPVITGRPQETTDGMILRASCKAKLREAGVELPNVENEEKIQLLDNGSEVLYVCRKNGVSFFELDVAGQEPQYSSGIDKQKEK